MVVVVLRRAKSISGFPEIPRVSLSPSLHPGRLCCACPSPASTATPTEWLTAGCRQPPTLQATRLSGNEHTAAHIYSLPLLDSPLQQPPYISILLVAPIGPVVTLFRKSSK
jgi:hypothetical protein